MHRNYIFIVAIFTSGLQFPSIYWFKHKTLHMTHKTNAGTSDYAFQMENSAVKPNMSLSSSIFLPVNSKPDMVSVCFISGIVCSWGPQWAWTKFWFYPAVRSNTDMTGKTSSSCLYISQGVFHSTIASLLSDLIT